MDTHFPYISLKGYASEHLSGPIVKRIMRKMILNKEKEEELKLIINLYDSAIRYVDSEIGFLLEKLKEADIYDSSVIIVTADHGDEFREHGSIGHGGMAYALPQKPHDELIHVPLIIKCPELGEGLVLDQVVSLLDLAPTILDLLGFPKEQEFRGESLLPVLRGEKKGGGVISESYVFRAKKEIISYRTSEWKFIMDKNTKKCELYNLKTDSKETNDLYEIETNKAEEMRQKILYHEMIKGKERVKREINRLKALKKI